MNYTEFYVVPTSVDATASNLNGGSGGTPILQSYTFSNDGPNGVMAIGCASNVGSLAGLAVGDWITWNTGAAKRRGRVVSVDGLTAGWPPSGLASKYQFTCVATDGGGNFDLVPTSVGASVLARGCWADPSTAAGLTTASVNAAGNPPRLNIYEPATYAVQMACPNNFTAAIPLTIEGYHTTPGDLRGTMAAPLISATIASGNGLVDVTGNYIIVRNVCSATSNVNYGTSGFRVTGNNVSLINCGATVGHGSCFKVSGANGLLDTCLINPTSTGSYAALFIQGDGCKVLNPRFTGTSSAGAVGNWMTVVTLINPVFYNFTGDCLVMTINSGGYTIIGPTSNGCAGNFLNAGTNADLTTTIIENGIFSGQTGLVVYSTAGTLVSLARYAHNLEYSIGGRFSANVLDNSEDIVTGSNPFANGGEIPTGGALSHPELMADGTLYTYPDLGAMQVLSTDPGAGNVKKNVTYYFGGIQYTGSAASGGGFIFGD